MKVTGKAVFLTGGAKGIGLALSEALLRKGAKVFFCDINATTGKATEAELQKQYGAGNVIFAQCDVTDADQLAGVFKKAVDSFGAVDIYVNNAGIANEQRMEQMIAINMTAQIRGCQLALEHMRRDKGGRGGVIINTASLTGLRAVYNLPVYTATKHAMIGFTQSWAMNPRMKEMGVRWGSLCPGPVETDLINEVKEGEAIDAKFHYDRCQRAKIQPEVVADAFMDIVENDDSNGVLMGVSSEFKGTRIIKRQFVDRDGVYSPVMADDRLPQAPNL